ncbi:MAG: radical SAM protein [Spirochaetes bacterium]|nr:radical SAM protein [Spirochaetota bacterium]
MDKNYLTLILTLKCNLACHFCPVKKKNVSLDFKTAKRAVDFFLSLKGKRKTIKLFGGEPLLEFDLLKKIVIYAKLKARDLKKQINFILPTNGIILDNEKLYFLRDQEIELVLSAHHLKNINKNILGHLAHFPRICLNMDILPKKVGILFPEFVRFYQKGFLKFNLLPAYYTVWSNKEVETLDRQLEKVGNFFCQHPEIHFANMDLIGEIPLYNSCYTVDPQGNIFSSNIILSKHFEKFKSLVLLGSVKDQNIKERTKTSLKQLVKNKLNKRILNSTFKVDHILNQFIEILENRRSIKRADIKVGYSCNNHCRFCVQGRKREVLPDMTTEEVKKILKKARKKCRGIVFTGGEPTIRKDILELADYAKSLGFERIQVQTNGRMFAYKKFCREAIKAGVNEFGLALHGHIPELQNYLTCSESFDETIQGFINLKELGQPIYTNTVITKSNYRHLPELAHLFVSLKVDQFQFAFVHPLGSAQDNFFSVVPRMSLVVPYVKRGLDIGIEKGLKVMTEAIPYCLMRGYEQYIAERLIPSTEIYELDLKMEFDQIRPSLAKIKGSNCIQCRYNHICEGTWREYPEKFSFSEFIPIT